MIIEITKNPRGGFGDFLTLGYVVLPSVILPQKYMVYAREGKDSIAHTPLVQKTLKGTISWPRGGNFGHASISLKLDDFVIEEPNALLCFTRYPSRQPILDQAYQLLARDIQYFIGGNYSDWSNIEYGRTNEKESDSWIDWHFRRKQLTVK